MRRDRSLGAAAIFAFRETGHKVNFRKTNNWKRYTIVSGDRESDCRVGRQLGAQLSRVRLLTAFRTRAVSSRADISIGSMRFFFPDDNWWSHSTDAVRKILQQLLTVSWSEFCDISRRDVSLFLYTPTSSRRIIHLVVSRPGRLAGSSRLRKTEVLRTQSFFRRLSVAVSITTPVS